jgi:WD40 repeat protein
MAGVTTGAAAAAVAEPPYAADRYSRRSRLLPPLPYPGIRPFRKEEWPIFCGRQQIVDELLQALGDARFLPVIGTSGCGKSSIMKAGLIATLEREHGALGATWQSVEMRPGNAPMWNLAEALWAAIPAAANRLAAAAPGQAKGTPEEIAAIRAMLGRGPGGIERVLREHGFPQDRDLLLLVDQFEELFRFESLGGEAEVSSFIDQLVDVFDGQPHGIHVVSTMRADFFAECARWPRLAGALNRTAYLLRWMTEDELREAITAPARLYRGEIEPKLVDRIIQDAGGEPDQLPVIQHALMWMWTRTGKACDAVLTLKDYEGEEVGGLDGALSRHADQIYDGLATASIDGSQRDLRPLAKQVFQSLSDIDPAGRAIRRARQFGELRTVAGCEARELQYVIDQFRKPGCSFLMPDEMRELKDTDPIDVSHEAVIRQWSKMNGTDTAKGWLEEERQDSEVWRLLAGEAATFQDDRNYRLSARQTQRFDTWWREREPSRAWVSRYSRDGAPAFEHASTLLRLSIRSHRQKRVLKITGVCGAVALVLGGAGFLLYQANQTQKAAIRAENERKLIAAELEVDKANAELLTTRAFKAASSWQTAEALQLAQDAMAYRSAAMAEGAAYNALSRHFLVREYDSGSAWDWPPNGQIIAQAVDRTIRFLEPKTGLQIDDLTISEGSIFNIDVSPDNRHVAVCNEEFGRVEIWDFRTDVKVTDDLGDWGLCWNLVFSAGGKWLGISDDVNVGVIDTTNWQTQIAHPDYLPTGGLVFSSDDQIVASVSQDGHAIIAHLELPAAPNFEAKLGDAAGLPAFAPSGRLLAVPVYDDSGGGQIALIDVEGGVSHDIRVPSTGLPSAVAFDPTGSKLALGMEDGTIHTLDVQAVQPTADGALIDQSRWQPLGSTEYGLPTALNFLPDRSALLVNSYDGPATILDAKSGKVRSILGAVGANYLTTFIDGGSLVLMDNSPKIGVWRTTPTVLQRHFKIDSEKEVQFQVHPLAVLESGNRTSPPSVGSKPADYTISDQIVQRTQSVEQKQNEQVVGVVYDDGGNPAILTRSSKAVLVRHHDGRRSDIVFPIDTDDHPLKSPKALICPNSNGLWIGIVDEVGSVSKSAMSHHDLVNIGTIKRDPVDAQIAMGIDSNGDVLAVASTGSAAFFDAAGSEPKPYSFTIDGKLQLIAVDADRQRVLVANDKFLSSVRLIDLPSNTTIDLPLSDLSALPIAGALSGNGRFAAVVLSNGTVNVWDVNRKTLIAAMGEPSQGLIMPAFPPQGGAIDVVASDGDIYRWRLFADREELIQAVKDALP